MSAFFGDEEKIQKTWILIVAGDFKFYTEIIQFGNYIKEKLEFLSESYRGGRVDGLLLKGI